MMLQKNGHAIFLKYSYEINVCSSLCQLLKKGDPMSLPLGDEALAPTSNGRGKIVNLKCLFLLPPIRMGKSRTRI
jgi:hypothetical protein